jgi:hypothetical protein
MRQIALEPSNVTMDHMGEQHLPQTPSGTVAPSGWPVEIMMDVDDPTVTPSEQQPELKTNTSSNSDSEPEVLRRWISKEPPLEYSVTRAKTLDGVVLPRTRLVSRLALNWAFGTKLGCMYPNPPQAAIKNAGREPLPSMRTMSGLSKKSGKGTSSAQAHKTWYSSHMAKQFALQYIAPLPETVLDRIRAPLKNLMDNPKVQNLKAPRSGCNPLRESLKSSPLNRSPGLITDESTLQTQVCPILRDVVHTVGTMFARSHIPGPAELCDAFQSQHNAGNRHETLSNPWLLRTASRPCTSPTVDMCFHLNPQLDSSFFDEKYNSYTLNPSLITPGNIALVGFEFKVKLDFDMPSFPMAYPYDVCDKVHGDLYHSRPLPHGYHLRDIKDVDTNSGDPEMADFSENRIQALRELLGEHLNTTGSFPWANKSKNLEQVSCRVTIE